METCERICELNIQLSDRFVYGLLLFAGTQNNFYY